VDIETPNSRSELRAVVEGCGGAGFTIAPASPDELLAALGVAQIHPVDDMLRELLENRLYDQLVEGTANSGREPSMLFCRQVDSDWSFVLEIDGTTGWVGCATQLLCEVSESFGIACSAFFDPNHARIFVSEDGELPCRLDVLTGDRSRELDDSLDVALVEAGFRHGGPRVMAPHLLELVSLDRIDVALTAVTGKSLSECLTGSNWICGLTRW
jgi:hypothetical protein